MTQQARPWVLSETNYGYTKDRPYDTAVLPLGATEPTAPVAVMANVLGAASPPGLSVDERLHHVLARFPDVKVHLYGKAERPARKVGHVTALGSRLEDVRARAVLAAEWLSTAVWADGWSPHDADARATRYPRAASRG